MKKRVIIKKRSGLLRKIFEKAKRNKASIIAVSFSAAIAVLLACAIAGKFEVNTGLKTGGIAKNALSVE